MIRGTERIIRPISKINLSGFGGIHVAELDDKTFIDFYSEPKVIDGDLGWEHVGDGRFKINDVSILSNILNKGDIKLYCWQNVFNNFAFCIVYHGQKKVELVKYDKKIHPPTYIDKCSDNRIDEPHKHRFKVGCPKGNKEIIPNEEIDRNDVDKALFDFFDECNITLNGEYFKLPKVKLQSILADFVEEEIIQ